MPNTYWYYYSSTTSAYTELFQLIKNNHLAFVCFFLLHKIGLPVTPLPNFARAKLRRKKMTYAILPFNLTWGWSAGKWKHYWLFHLNCFVAFLDLTLVLMSMISLLGSQRTLHAIGCPTGFWPNPILCHPQPHPPTHQCSCTAQEVHGNAMVLVSFSKNQG